MRAIAGIGPRAFGPCLLTKVDSVTPEQCQESVIEQLEQLTDKKVLLIEEPSLTVHSNLKLAGPSEAAHILRYRGNLKQHLPYLVASQCGLVLRMLQTEPDQRFDLSSVLGLPERIQKLTLARLQKNGVSLSEESLATLSGMYQNTIGVQLRSIPVSLRVDDSIRQQFPALTDMQRACTIHHLKEGMATLAPNIRRNIPDEIFHPRAGMNAALAGYWARVFNDESLIVGFKATGFWNTGTKLLQQFNEIPPAPDNDRQLVQSWIDTLGLQQWFFTTTRQRI